MKGAGHVVLSAFGGRLQQSLVRRSWLRLYERNLMGLSLKSTSSKVLASAALLAAARRGRHGHLRWLHHQHLGFRDHGPAPRNGYLMGLNLKSTSSKVLASAALLAAAAGVAGMGTYGGFTTSTSASATVEAGTVNLDVGADSGTAQRPGFASHPGRHHPAYPQPDNSGTTTWPRLPSRRPLRPRSPGLGCGQRPADGDRRVPGCVDGTGAGPYTCNSPGTTGRVLVLPARSDRGATFR